MSRTWLAVLACSACVGGASGLPPDAGIDAGSDSGTAAGPGGGAPDSGPQPVQDDGGTTPDAGTVSMALSVSGSRLLLPDGGPLVVRGAISCCGGGYGWPLFDDAWLAYTASKQVNLLHLRLGPFLTQTANGETDWAPVGGGYVESGGVADLTQFNSAFWTRLSELIGAARRNGQWVEVTVVDSWAIKHCRHGDLPGYSPWDPAFNLQGENDCATSGSQPIALGSTEERWVRQVVDVTGAFDNVLYEDGNEAGLVPGYDPAWTISLAALVHDEESRRGYLRHLVSSNSGNATANQAVDYVELHQTTAATLAQCGGAPCLVNEYNPDPALTPEEFFAQYCLARSQGTWFWYWRHGQTEAQMNASLDLQAGGCP